MAAAIERAFCAYFDSRFLPRGLALYASLKRHSPRLRLWLLCLDEACHRTLCALDLEGVRLLRLSDLERCDPELLKVKKDRTSLEYALTCTPILPLHVLETCPEVGLLTYLDADLYFFSNPEPLFAEMGPASIAITPHRYPPPFQHWERHTGVYNDGWVSFRRDPQALDCLRRWRRQCLEWCYNRSENGRFTEQQYLDDWPQRFPGVAVLRHPGANVGPWNLGAAKIRREESRAQGLGGRVLAGDQPLIFFHFSGIKQVAPWLYDLNLADFRVRPCRAARDAVFAPYLRELRTVAQSALKTAGRKEEQLAAQPLGSGAQPLGSAAQLWSLRRAVYGLANGYWAFFVNGQVL